MFFDDGCYGLGCIQGQRREPRRSSPAEEVTDGTSTGRVRRTHDEGGAPSPGSRVWAEGRAADAPQRLWGMAVAPQVLLSLALGVVFPPLPDVLGRAVAEKTPSLRGSSAASVCEGASIEAG